MNSKKFKSGYYSLMCFKGIGATLIVLLIVTSCISALYIPTESDAARNNTSLETLNSGRRLYLNHCGGCHNLYLPLQYNKQDWIRIMDKMQEPAKIDNSQKEVIMTYLEAGCKK
jgi:hypothetical protein